MELVTGGVIVAVILVVIAVSIAFTFFRALFDLARILISLAVLGVFGGGWWLLDYLEVL